MKKVFKIILSVILIVAAVLFIVGGVKDINKIKSYPKADAVITDITVEEGIGEDEADTHHVYVEYTVDGKEYSGELGAYDIGMDIGDHAEVSYNPDNPAEFLNSSYLSPIMMFVFAVIAVIAALILFRKAIVHKK